MEKITRSEARRLGQKTYFTAAPCPKGHVGPRSVSDKKCVACKSIANAAYRANSTYYQQWRSKNPEYFARWASNNPDLVRRYRLKHHAVNNPKRRKQNGHDIDPRAKPAWADDARILSLYDEARRLTGETGVEHVVDHIIPLKSERICGLHVHQNLQVITKTENSRKYNKLPDLQPFVARLISGPFL